MEDISIELGPVQRRPEPRSLLRSIFSLFPTIHSNDTLPTYVEPEEPTTEEENNTIKDIFRVTEGHVFENGGLKFDELYSGLIEKEPDITMLSTVESIMNRLSTPIHSEKIELTKQIELKNTDIRLLLSEFLSTYQIGCGYVVKCKLNFEMDEHNMSSILIHSHIDALGPTRIFAIGNGSMIISSFRNIVNGVRITKEFIERVVRYDYWESYEGIKSEGRVYIKRTLRSIYLFTYLNKYKYIEDIPGILAMHKGVEDYIVKVETWARIKAFILSIKPTHTNQSYFDIFNMYTHKEMEGFVDIRVVLTLLSNSIEYK